MSDHKPNKCYYKPKRNKPRYWTAKKVAEVYCQARADTGATASEFIKECKCWDGKEGECEELKQTVDLALNILAGVLLSILLPESMIARAVLAVARWIPARWIASTGLTRLLAELPSASADLERVIEMLRVSRRIGPP